jgi:hypothetical protein
MLSTVFLYARNLGHAIVELNSVPHPKRRSYQYLYIIISAIMVVLLLVFATVVWSVHVKNPHRLIRILSGTGPLISQTPNPSRFRPSVSIMLRTYHKDQRIMGLLRDLERFVNPDKYAFVVVLDEDSSEDHVYGEKLSVIFPGAAVRYRSLPPNCSAMPCEGFFHATAFAGDNYGRAGYDRQQWDTFHLDEHSSSDIVGVVDSDACIFTYMMDESILSQENRIYLRALDLKPLTYKNDLVALQLSTKEFCEETKIWPHQPNCPDDHPDDDFSYNFMYTDAMPIWFWRDTLPLCRAFIAKRWNSTFAHAFVEFSRLSFSQFNILANCALFLQPDKYQLVIPSSAEGVVTVGSNRCRPGDTEIGCCRSFDVGCDGSDPHDIEHLLRFNNAHVAWLANESFARRKSSEYYQNVHEEISRSVNETSHGKIRECIKACLPSSEMRYETIHGMLFKDEST